MEQINVNADPSQAQKDAEAAHNAEMIKKVDDAQARSAEAANAPASQVSDTPKEGTLLAGKYKTEDELKKGCEELAKKLEQPIYNFASTAEYEKRYQELEKKLGSQSQTPPEDKAKAEADAKAKAEADAKKTDEEKAKEAASKVSTEEMAAFDKEFKEKGELSKESYDKLAAKGIPKEMVDLYIEGQKAIVERNQNAAATLEKTLFGITGNEDSYKAEINWAKDNFTKQEIEAFNAALESSPEQAKLAVEGLHAKFTKANPNIVMGDGSGSSTVSGYESKSQMTADINDPRYAKDPAFRKMVRDKIARSTAI